MSKEELPDWLSGYRQELGISDERRKQAWIKIKQNWKEEKAKYEALSLYWMPLQTAALKLLDRWEELEVQRIFGVVAKDVYKGNFENPDTRSFWVTSGQNNEFRVVEEKTDPSQWKCVKKESHCLLAAEINLDDKFVWKFTNPDGKADSYSYDPSPKEIRYCFAGLQAREIIKPSELSLSCVQRIIYQMRWDWEDGNYWSAIGQLRMDFNFIRADVLDIRIPITNFKSPRELEVRVDNLLTEKFRSNEIQTWLKKAPK